MAQAQEIDLTRKRLKTPRAAAIAGIIFSLWLIASLTIIRLSIPANPNEPGLWLENQTSLLGFLMAIAFLWFIGVIRDLIGEMEDKFFATVFLGSGLLFIAMLFASAAVARQSCLSYKSFHSKG